MAHRRGEGTDENSTHCTCCRTSNRFKSREEVVVRVEEEAKHQGANGTTSLCTLAFHLDRSDKASALPVHLVDISQVHHCFSGLRKPIYALTKA